MVSDVEITKRAVYGRMQGLDNTADNIVEYTFLCTGRVLSQADGHSISANRLFMVNGIKKHVRKKRKCLETGEKNS